MAKNATKKQGARGPDWLTETPEEITYYLEMYDPHDEPQQHVDLTREEYIALKKHLAKMRGIAIPKAA